MKLDKLKQLEDIYYKGFKEKTGLSPQYAYGTNRKLFNDLVERYSKELGEEGAFRLVKLGLRVWLKEEIGKYSGYKLSCFVQRDWNKVLLRLKELKEKRREERRKRKRKEQHLRDKASLESGGKVTDRETALKNIKRIKENLQP